MSSYGRKVVLLDLDGTLSKSDPGILASIKYACAAVNLPEPSAEELNRFIGPPIVESLARNGITGENLIRGVAAYREAYANPHFPDPSHPGELLPGMFLNTVYAGIPLALDIMRNQGYILAVATAKPEPQARPVCNYLRLTNHIDALYGASLDASRRHKADVIRYAFENLHFSAENGDSAIMVGDRWTDVDGAKEVGIDCIGVRWGYAEANELESHGAVAFADKVHDLPSAVDSYFLTRGR